jgi:hydrogenase/urease accessory protein HupE
VSILRFHRPSIFAFLLVTASVAWAHEVRPAYLEIKETAPGQYSVLWRTPVLAGMRLPIVLKLPSDVKEVREPSVQELADSVVERHWIDAGPNGLAGKRIELPGLQLTITDVLVRVEMLDGRMQVTRLTPSTPSFVVEAAPNVLEVARTYTVLGIEHILTGIDHLLFVLALIIITQGGWKLVKTVTAFTVSHSITLTLATLGYVHVPQRPVEAAIALSIVFVAAEILRGRQGHVGITARAPWVVAFMFGLMHGLGFASGLKDAGLPDGHIPTALLFFSIGVEAGHFLFIGCVLALTAAMLRAASRLMPINQQRSAFLQLVPPYAIGTVAMFWVIQRVAAF